MVSQALFDRAVSLLSAAHTKKTDAAIPWATILEALIAFFGGCFSTAPTVGQVRERAKAFSILDRMWLIFTVRRALRSEGGWRMLRYASDIVDTLVEVAPQARDNDIAEAIEGEFDWDI